MFPIRLTQSTRYLSLKNSLFSIKLAVALTSCLGFGCAYCFYPVEVFDKTGIVCAQFYGQIALVGSITAFCVATVLGRSARTKPFAYLLAVVSAGGICFILNNHDMLNDLYEFSKHGAPIDLKCFFRSFFLLVFPGINGALLTIVIMNSLNKEEQVSPVSSLLNQKAQSIDDEIISSKARDPLAGPKL
jgi:hypothetical protein